MLDFICKGSADLTRRDTSEKMKMKINVSTGYLTSDPLRSSPTPSPFGHRDSWLSVFKLFQYSEVTDNAWGVSKHVAIQWIKLILVVTFQDSHRTVFTFRSWLDLLGVVLALWISILKISMLLQNCWHRVIDITSFEKHLESSSDHTLNFFRNLVSFRSKNICQKESLTRSSTVI